MCGTPAQVAGCDASSKPATPSPRTCNTCGTQSATVSCNYSTSQWQTTWGDCSVFSSSSCCTWVHDEGWLSFSESWNTGGSSAPYYGCTSTWQKSWGQLSTDQRNSASSIATRNFYLLESKAGSCGQSSSYYGDPSTLTATCTVSSGKATFSIKFKKFTCSCK